MIRYISWLLAVTVPFAIAWSIGAVPYPGSLFIAAALVGLFIGCLLYEHATYREEVPRSVLFEQILVGVLILAVLSLVF